MLNNNEYQRSFHKSIAMWHEFSVDISNNKFFDYIRYCVTDDIYAEVILIILLQNSMPIAYCILLKIFI